jgi:3-methyladenine DNA glycosylase AlkD
MATARIAAKRPAAKGAKATKAARPAKAPRPRLSLAEVMGLLEKAGTAQACKTYRRHGAPDPMFGVSFATLKTLVKRIGVDHDLALALWETGNFDARNLAMKIADPSRMSSADLDRWAGDFQARMCGVYVASLAVEGPHAAAKAAQWLASRKDPERWAGWGLVGQMALRHEATPDAWFADRLAEIERSIHAVADAEREAMNMAIIYIGGRSPALRKAALAAAKRIGPVEVDHGDTACKTPAAGPYIEKLWAHAAAKSFATPAEQERARESPRTRC